jgi:hypothetical protein
VAITQVNNESVVKNLAQPHDKCIVMSFSMSHTVTLAFPISVVFPTLADAQQLERLQRLTPEAQHFTLLPSDRVQLPTGGLAPLVTPDFPSSPEGIPRPRTMDKYEDSEAESMGGRVVERSWFEFGGTVPLLFGLINSPLQVAGAQVVDPDARIVLFESGVASQGIKELKLRVFEEVELGGGKKGTKVKEIVWGTCPWLLSRILRFIAPGVHKHHMELYHKLFDLKNSS